MEDKMKKNLLLSLIALFSLAATVSASPFLYSQAYDPNSTSAWNSTRVYSDDHSTYADYYQCFSDYYYDGTYAITDFHWWGARSIGGSPDGFLFQIYADNGSDMPGSMVYSEFITGSADETFVATNPNYGIDVYKYGIDLAAPWTASAGDYWFSVVGAFTQSNPNTFFWAQTDGIYGAWDWQDDFSDPLYHPDQRVDFAFEVSGDTSVVPEPATACLLGLGLIGGGILRRRRNRLG
jgi:hypothetical protein